ncbi:MAG: hypothetical protein BGO67_10065 [Alphaproteobacteria bacterium 41-28]|nr:MAG: hypothetical protein BGO67_10065 [Alphaproteobacteria bacterium 41-28]
MISSVAEWQCDREQNCGLLLANIGKFLFLMALLNLSINPAFLKADSQAMPASKPVASKDFSFFEKRAEGWHWYESSDQYSVFSNQKKPSQTPTEVIEGQRKELEQKLHAAIIEPTRENVIAYILAQRALMDQSQHFSESWKRIVMTTPSLDETLVHPVDQNARHVYYNEQHKELQIRIKDLAQEYGLFFFFKKNCPYCHGFAPIVKRFSEKHGWSVLAISMDGGSLPEFPHAKRDNGISQHLQVSHVPALIALHPKTGKLIPLSYGMVSESEIEARVELLTQLFQGARK